MSFRKLFWVFICMFVLTGGAEASKKRGRAITLSHHGVPDADTPETSQFRKLMEQGASPHSAAASVTEKRASKRQRTSHSQPRETSVESRLRTQNRAQRIEIASLKQRLEEQEAPSSEQQRSAEGKEEADIIDEINDLQQQIREGFAPEIKQRVHTQFLDKVLEALAGEPHETEQASKAIVSIFEFLGSQAEAYPESTALDEMRYIYYDNDPSNRYKKVQEISEEMLEKKEADVLRINLEECKPSYEQMVADKSALASLIEQKPILELLKRSGRSFFNSINAATSTLILVIRSKREEDFNQLLKTPNAAESKALYYQLFKNISLRGVDRRVLSTLANRIKDEHPAITYPRNNIEFTLNDIEWDEKFADEASLNPQKAYEDLASNPDGTQRNPLLKLLQKDQTTMASIRENANVILNAISNSLDTLTSNELKAIGFYLFSPGNHGGKRPTRGFSADLKSAIDSATNGRINQHVSARQLSEDDHDALETAMTLLPEKGVTTSIFDHMSIQTEGSIPELREEVADLEAKMTAVDEAIHATKASDKEAKKVLRKQKRVLHAQIYDKNNSLQSMIESMQRNIDKLQSDKLQIDAQVKNTSLPREEKKTLREQARKLRSQILEQQALLEEPL